MSLSTEGFTLLGTLKAPSLGGAMAANVPMLIKAAALTTDMDTSLKADWGDLRLSTDASGNNQLPLDIVEGGSIAWTRLPSVAADVLIRVWGNKPAATQPAVTDPFGSEAVWSGEVDVFHQNGETGNLTNSTGGASAVRSGTSLAGAAIAGFGSSVDFNASAYYTHSDPSEGQAQFTARGWIASPSSAVSEGIIGAWTSATAGNAGMSVLVFTGSAGELSFRVRNAANTVVTASSTTVVQGSDTPIHYAAVYDGAEIRILINGIDEDSAALTGNIATSAAQFEIGRYNSSPTNIWSARQQELVISQTGLSTDQISIEYQNQSAVGAWWIADDAGGTITVTESAQLINWSSQDPSINFTGIISIQESTQLISFNAQDPIIEFTGSITIEESTQSINWATENPLITLTPPNTIAITESVRAIGWISQDPTVLFRGTINVTESTQTINMLTQNPSVDFGTLWTDKAAITTTWTNAPISSTIWTDK